MSYNIQSCSGDGDFWGSPIPIPKSRGWGLGMSHFWKKSPGMGIFGDRDGFSWDGMGIPENPRIWFFPGKDRKSQKNEPSRIVKNVWNPQISWQLAQHFYWFQQRLLLNIIGLVFTVGEKKVSELCNWVYFISYLRKFFYSFCKGNSWNGYSQIFA